jgi:3alpha(or 20beta)-hydroxysteroid dehydrogenase
VNRIDGKVAIITGAARGQGAATAQLFAEAGAVVYATDIAGAVEPAHAGCSFLRHDVSSPDEWARVVRRVLEERKRIDVLVNNAAIIEWQTMTETTLEAWQRVVAVNQTGPFLGMQAVAPTMKKQGSGSIINISSVGGLGGASACFAYGATKWALRGMTRSAAQELGRYGVRVNAVLPGTIETAMIEGRDLSGFASRTPLRRVGRPEEVAKLSLWLASEDSAYTSGADFVIDGGAKA